MTVTESGPPSDAQNWAADTAADPEFLELRRRLRRFAFPVTGGFLAWYLLYVVLADYAHEFSPMTGLAAGVAGSNTTLNIAVFSGGTDEYAYTAAESAAAALSGPAAALLPAVRPDQRVRRALSNGDRSEAHDDAGSCVTRCCHDVSEVGEEKGRDVGCTDDIC